MKLRTETKEILFAVFLFFVASGIALSMLGGMSGCTTTTTKEQAKEIIKPFYEAGKEIYTEEKLKDEDTKAKDNLGGTGTGDIKTEETKQEAENKDQNSESVDKSKIIDDFPLSDLTSNVSVDTPQLANHYTGFQNQTHPWSLMKDVPLTVKIDSFNAGGISLSGSTVRQGKFEDGKWERTSCFWAFDENGNELGYDDHAYTSYEQPARFYGKAKYILVVSTADFGNTFQITGRSKVTEVK